MSEKTKDWFVEERTRALARVHLTRREDLIVTEGGDDFGLVYIVFIAKEAEKASVRQFGVALRGSLTPVSDQHLNKKLRSAIQSFHGIGPFPYPVCLLHFTMEDNQGHVTWLAEPVVTPDGPRLITHSEANCRKLDREQLDVIVDQVDRWYDAFFASIAVEAS